MAFGLRPYINVSLFYQASVTVQISNWKIYYEFEIRIRSVRDR